MPKRFWGLSDDDSSSEGSPGPLGVHRYPCLIVPEQWFTKTLDDSSLYVTLSCLSSFPFRKPTTEKLSKNQQVVSFP